MQRKNSAQGQDLMSALSHSRSDLPLPAQPVDATQALNLSAGVSNCKVSRGRSFRGPVDFSEVRARRDPTRLRSVSYHPERRRAEQCCCDGGFSRRSGWRHRPRNPVRSILGSAPMATRQPQSHIAA